MSRRARARPSAGRSAVRVAAVPSLYHFGVRLFAIFTMAMLVAFWPSYFSRLAEQPSSHHHAHGIAMSLWLVLLIAQASLMRAGNRALHRRLGLLSFLLVPVIVAVTLRFVHYTLQEVPRLGASASALFFLALVVITLVVFVVLFALAMLYRKQPAVHARFMVATLFPLFPPVTDRLIGRFMPSIIDAMPRIGGGPIVQCAGFAIADAILVGLSIWDWRANQRRVFPVALAIVVAGQSAILTLHRFEFWQAFGPWFVALPLS
jgi:FtsH-binding integral membrane protein